MGKDYKIGITTTGDTSGAEEVEAALGQMEEAAAAVGKTAEEAFAAAKAALDPADWTLDELEKALKEINDELGKVPRGTKQYTELQKASKLVSDEIKTAKAGLKGQLDTLAATRVTGINQAAELFNKLTSQVGDFSDKLREAGFEEAADKIDFFSGALQRATELAAVGMGLSLVVTRLGGLTMALQRATAASMAFVASPIGATMVAAAAAAVALKAAMDGAADATAKFMESANKPTNLLATADEANTLADAMERAEEAAEGFKQRQGEIAKQMEAAAKLQERLNRTAEKIDDLQTESELERLDASGLSPAAKAVKRAEIENAARERKRVREEKAEEDKIAQKEAMAAQREGAAALSREEAARVRGGLAGAEAEVKRTGDEAAARIAAKRAEIDARPARVLPDILGQDEAELQREMNSAMAPYLRAQQELVNQRNILNPQAEGLEGQATGAEAEAAELRAEVARMRAEMAAARPGERVATGMESGNLTQAAQNTAGQAAAQALDAVRAQAGNEFTAADGIAEGIARVARDLAAGRAKTAAQFEGIMRSIAQLESAAAASRETGL